MDLIFSWILMHLLMLIISHQEKRKIPKQLEILTKIEIIIITVILLFMNCSPFRGVLVAGSFFIRSRFCAFKLPLIVCWLNIKFRLLLTSKLNFYYECKYIYYLSILIISKSLKWERELNGAGMMLYIKFLNQKV